MPEMVAQLGAATEETLDCTMSTAGGMTLEWHSTHAETLAAIRPGGWDWLVLQEQSLRPLDNRALFGAAARVLAAEGTVQGARVLLYMTWARQHQPHMQAHLAEAYRAVGEAIGARVAPVGLAWAAAMAAQSGLVLHVEDRSHPNPLGSYLAACVFFAVLTGRSPEGLPVAINTSQGAVTLAPAKAAIAQRVAWETACLEVECSGA
jgi:hypothetical protein